MNAIEQAREAYAPTQTAIRTPRAIEAQLINQITTRLRDAFENVSRSFPDLVSALHANRQLWTTFATSVSDNDNHLPKDLRARLFFLAQFVEIHSGSVLRGETNVDPLIEINMAVLRGLSDRVAN